MRATLTHDSFKTKQFIPGLTQPRVGPVPGVDAYGLADGEDLVGPVPVVIAKHEYHGFYIEVGGEKYWLEDYNGEQCWYQSGYYLRFFPEGTVVEYSCEEIARLSAEVERLRSERDRLLAACKLALSWVVNEEAANAVRDAISMAETGRPFEYEPPEVQEAFLAEHRRARSERRSASAPSEDR